MSYDLLTWVVHEGELYVLIIIIHGMLRNACLNMICGMLNKMVWKLYELEYKCPNDAWMTMHEYECYICYIYIWHNSIARARKHSMTWV